MKWVTREHVHIDRVAGPWLIKNFIDEDPEFIFVPLDEVMNVAQREGAIPFDAKGQAEIDRREGRCSFESFIMKYELTDPALHELAKIVSLKAPEAAGLDVISRGFGLICASDHEILEKQFPVYDALYAYCKSKLEQ